jgi:hypothetical protein
MNTPEDLLRPYQPPEAELSKPNEQLPALAPHERSGAPKVFGVLSITFASIQLLLATFGLLGAAAAGLGESASSVAADPDKAAEVGALLHPVAQIYKGFGLESLILFVMSVLLLVIGIGQLRYRRWARSWSVYWGGAGLVGVALLVAISLLIISPGYAALMDAASQVKPAQSDAAGSMAGLGAVFGGTFAVISVLLYTPYPALMLLFFTRDHVRASMTE